MSRLASPEMTATEELELYLSTSRDSRQTWLQRVSQNVAKQRGSPCAPRDRTDTSLEATAHPQRVVAGALGPSVASTAKLSHRQHGHAQPNLSKPSKAALLLKLKLAQQQRNVVAHDHKGPCEPKSQTHATRKLAGTKSVQRSVSFELPPSNLPQDSAASNLRPVKGLQLPTPPAWRCRSALKVTSCPFSNACMALPRMYLHGTGAVHPALCTFDCMLLMEMHAMLDFSSPAAQMHCASCMLVSAVQTPDGIHLCEKPDAKPGPLPHPHVASDRACHSEATSMQLPLQAVCKQPFRACYQLPSISAVASCRTSCLLHAFERQWPQTDNSFGQKLLRHGVSRGEVHVCEQDKASIRPRTSEWLGRNDKELNIPPFLQAHHSTSSRTADGAPANGMHSAPGNHYQAMLAVQTMTNCCSSGSGPERPFTTPPAQHAQGCAPEPPSSLSRASRYAA